MRLILAVTALISSPAFGQACTEEVRNSRIALSQEAKQCVRTNAARLNQSGQLPSDIATAAMIACEKPLMQIRGMCSSPTFSDLLEDQLRKHAIAVVVEARSRK